MLKDLADIALVISRQTGLSDSVFVPWNRRSHRTWASVSMTARLQRFSNTSTIEHCRKLLDDWIGPLQSSPYDCSREDIRIHLT